MERRPGLLVYGLLTAFVLGSCAPLYWSFLVGSHSREVLTKRVPPLLPGGHFWDNAQRAIDAVPFWKALANSLVVSGTVATSVVFVIITSTIGGLQIFAEPRLFDTQGLGGADRQYQTLTMYLWELGWRVRDLGMASAVAWLLFLIIVVFAVLNLAISRRAGSLRGAR